MCVEFDLLCVSCEQTTYVPLFVHAEFGRLKGGSPEGARPHPLPLAKAVGNASSQVLMILYLYWVKPHLWKESTSFSGQGPEPRHGTRPGVQLLAGTQRE